MTDNTAAKAISETPISDVGNWTEDGDRVQINITAAGREVKLCMPSPTKPLEITIPKKDVTVKGNVEKPKTKPISNVGEWTEYQDHVQINITAAGKDVKLCIDQQTSPTKPLEIAIPKKQADVEVKGETPNDGSDKRTGKVGSDQQQKGSKRDETMLENVMIKLKAYKGIVITAFIAISLGYLLRRKFKVA
ncbi:uncharacterized protein LOC100246789 isoform X1 [Vitis vinifera]|uniref:Uncharacterized protein n=2 Tax=Vitis vinifera TaxID=29760 RepID=A0A438I358_VITVI|nr:uncharacterized protein LOC100246789 isoform X1 [Vitis vinifera]RVW91153.1 hypothetical protein CK203_031789 [Vitis vinifera]|eukprot:XP_002272600.1 PREDICTED: uncharacterized protein LOC100246789 isoform X1 [Vitis vinifera]